MVWEVEPIEIYQERFGETVFLCVDLMPAESIVAQSAFATYLASVCSDQEQDQAKALDSDIVEYCVPAEKPRGPVLMAMIACSTMGGFLLVNSGGSR